MYFAFANGKHVEIVFLYSMPFIRRLLMALLCLLSSTSMAQQVVVNKGNSIQKLSISQLRSIFLMRLTEWQDGTPVTVFVLLPSGKIHAEFCQNILGLFPYQLQQTWDRAVFSGIGEAPLIVSSPDDMKKKVGSIKGAIGYIEDDMLDDSVNVVTIDATQ